MYLISSSVSYSIERPEIKNLIVHKDKKKIENIEFIKSDGQKVSLNDYKSYPLIINFWATWCAPCKEEMPSLDKLSQNKKFRNLEILAVNMERVNVLKVKKFFNDLNIKNLPFFFDRDFSFVKEFKLRGVPTTILINKNNEEFARITGSFDFENKQFIKWLSKYD